MRSWIRDLIDLKTQISVLQNWMQQSYIAMLRLQQTAWPGSAWIDRSMQGSGCLTGLDY
jgi:hypothetical protein